MAGEIRIEKCIYGGEGIGRLRDGRAVFIPYTLPGEVVEIEISESKGKFARGKISKLVKASASRAAPPCPYFAECGGCHYQMLSYAEQVELKSLILREQLERLGGISLEGPVKVLPSPSPFKYRNQVQFHPLKNGRLGMMAGDGRTPVEVERCMLARDGINEVKALVDLGEEAGLSRVSFREDSLGNQLILLEGNEVEPPDLELDLPVSLAYKSKLNPDSQQIAGEDFLVYELLGKRWFVSPLSFFQVNLEMAEEMIRQVEKYLPDEKLGTIVELYAGVGLFSAFLAEHCHRLAALEASPSACYDFADNLAEFEHVELYEGPVEETLGSLIHELSPADLVLLDPPRTGLMPRAREAVLKLAPKQIIYISCDPASLARDLKAMLGSGYRLESVVGFDMFPQTYHVETILFVSRVKD